MRTFSASLLGMALACGHPEPPRRPSVSAPRESATVATVAPETAPERHAEARPKPRCQLDGYDVMRDPIPAPVLEECQRACLQAGSADTCRAAGDAFWAEAEIMPDPPAAYAIAATAYQRCCDENDPDCCNNLGLAYTHGQGVHEDAARAQQLFDKACRMGSEAACFNGSN